MSWLHRLIWRVAWPSFDCEDCIGMKEWGCQCIAIGGVAPGTPPRWYHRFARWLNLRIVWDGDL